MTRRAVDVDHWCEGDRETFETAGLAAFEALWSLDLPLVEAPNLERGGRSGVVVLDLEKAGRFYLKRQDGHLTRSIRPPFSRIPTVQREWRALRRLAEGGLVAARPIYFGRRGHRAILVTEEVRSRGSLDEIWATLGARDRLAVARALGRELARFHALGLRHGALYPKHLLLLAEEPPAFGFIDLEKCRGVFPLERARRHDLDALNRRSGTFGSSARLAFLRAYCADRPDRLRGYWRVLAERAAKRGMRA